MRQCILSHLTVCLFVLAIAGCDRSAESTAERSDVKVTATTPTESQSTIDSLDLTVGDDVDPMQGISIQVISDEQSDVAGQVCSFTMTVGASDTVFTRAAMKVNQVGDTTQLTITNAPFIEQHLAASDGCKLKYNNGKVVGCEKDGDNCQYGCRLRSWNGSLYCICSANADEPPVTSEVTSKGEASGDAPEE